MQTDQRKLPSSDNVEQTEPRPVAENQEPQQHEAVTETDEEQQKQAALNDFQESTEQPIYIMVPKLYSESVSLRDEGPRSSTKYSSSCVYKTPQTYITQAGIVPRLIPKYYITMVRVDGEKEDIVTYHERVEFVYTLRIKEFSETVNSFPKEVSNNFVTTLTYIPNYTYRHYVTSLVMEPAQMLKLPVREDDALPNCVTENEITAICNGREMNLRGSWEKERQPAVELLNGTA